jgi:hypothetical protein
MTRTLANNPAPLTMNQPIPLGPFGVAELARATCAAVVWMVRVAVAGEPVTSTDGVIVQVIRAVEGGGVQVRVTVPLKLFSGSTVMVEVPELPGDAMVTAGPPTVKVAAGVNPGQLVTSVLALIEPRPLA